MPTAEMPMHFVTREDWEAQPPKGEIPPLQHPIKYVRLVFTKGVKECTTSKGCTKRMKDLQEENMTAKDLLDIQPNFVVTGDGYVYEGRGWRLQPEGIPERPDLDGQFVEFAYLGDYREKPPSKEMLRLSWLAMRCGVKNKFLEKKFEILELGGPAFPSIGEY